MSKWSCPHCKAINAELASKCHNCAAPVVLELTHVRADLPAIVESRINAFLERGIYTSGADVLCAAMDLLVEKQIAEESKTWGHTIESGCHPDCPDWEGPPKAGVSVKKEAHAYVNNCDFVGDGYWTGVSAYLAGYEAAQARAHLYKDKNNQISSRTASGKRSTQAHEGVFMHAVPFQLKFKSTEPPENPNMVTETDFLGVVIFKKSRRNTDKYRVYVQYGDGPEFVGEMSIYNPEYWSAVEGYVWKWLKDRDLAADWNGVEVEFNELLRMGKEEFVERVKSKGATVRFW